MVFRPFQELLPEIAKNETRSIIFSQRLPGGPPAGQYVFFELFCDELDCNCCNAMIAVHHVEENRIVARLRYLWKKPEYYQKLDLDFGKQVPGVCIDFFESRQNPYNKYFVNTLRAMCYDDAKNETEYAKRIKRHYKQFRQQLKQEAQDSDEAVLQAIPEPDDPCTCVSGKKFKFCCGPIFPYIIEAMCAAEDGLNKQALEWMSKAEKLVGNTAEVLCRKAIVYSFFDNKKHAEYLQKCLEVNPRHPRAHYLQGINFKNKEENEAAIAAYLRSIQYYLPTDHYHLNEVYNNLANVYHDIGEQAKAIAAWKMAIEYSPTDKMARRNLQEFGRMHEKG